MFDQEEIHNQCFSEDPKERIKALDLLKTNFLLLPDKQQAWNDLIIMTNDEDIHVKCGAISALGSAFPHVSDKQRAWNDLHRLTTDQDCWVSSEAASSISFSFLYLPDKQQAWEDLLRLATDQNNFLSFIVVDAIGSAFQYIPDKQQAWNELIELLTDENDIDTEYSAASALGSAFPYMPDRQKAWNDLVKLTNDNDDVYFFVNHSLGKISIFKALQAEKEEDYEKELEKAIEFFEKEAQESCCLWEEWDNPYKFCLPFYRSFYIITFKKPTAKNEVDKYLAEAKAAITYSKSKALLFEAVENLAKALKEVQDLQNLDFEEKKCRLNFYRKYLDRATQLMKDTGEKAPHATGILRKGLPILDRNLKELLEEIQNKAKIACKESEGTDTEEIACTVNREVKNWEIGSQEEMTQKIENLAYVLEEKISVQPKNQFVFSKIEQMKSERSLVKQYEILAQIIPLIRNITVVPEDTVKEGFENLNKGINNIYDKLEEMSIALNPKNRAELVISKGIMVGGVGAQVVSTIPLEKISYPELLEDLENIKERAIKVSELPSRLVNKIKSYLS